MSDLDKGLDPLMTVSSTSLLELISLLINHARSRGKDDFGFYIHFAASSVRTIENSSIFGQYSEKLINAVCLKLTTQEENNQFEKIIEKTNRGREREYYRLNLKTDKLIQLISLIGKTDNSDDNEIIFEQNELEVNLDIIGNNNADESSVFDQENSVYSERYCDDKSSAGGTEVSGSVIVKPLTEAERLAFLSDNEDSIGDDEDPNEISVDCSSVTDISVLSPDCKSPLIMSPMSVISPLLVSSSLEEQKEVEDSDEDVSVIDASLIDAHRPGSVPDPYLYLAEEDDSDFSNVSPHTQVNTPIEDSDWTPDTPAANHEMNISQISELSEEFDGSVRVSEATPAIRNSTVRLDHKFKEYTKKK